MFIYMNHVEKSFDNSFLIEQKLGDGCYHVYLDVGSNIGMHGRFVFEPKAFPGNRSNWAYPQHVKMMHIFDENFGKDRDINSKNGNVCVFAFEPNPVHRARHLQLKEFYKKLDLRYHPIPFGVGDQDGTITFYHQDQGKNNEWGFSAKKIYDKEDISRSKNVTEVEVDVIRLSTWIRKNILGRNIPEIYPPPSNAPKVLMKLDVEGMEYILLPDLMFSGVLCEAVDLITTELHPFSVHMNPSEKTKRGGLKLKNKREAKQFGSILLQAFHSLRNDDCKLSRIELLDDESYHIDVTTLN